MPVFGEQDYPEETRLKYRFIDLRRKEMHENIILRSKVISFIRNKMIEDLYHVKTPVPGTDIFAGSKALSKGLPDYIKNLYPFFNIFWAFF